MVHDFFGGVIVSIGARDCAANLQGLHTPSFVKNFRTDVTFLVFSAHTHQCSPFQFLLFLVVHLTQQERFMQALTPILPNLERFVRALVRRRGTISETTETARDILAETIAQAFERFPTLRRPESLLSFCFTIATRLNRRDIDSQRRFTSLDDSAESHFCHEERTDNADVQLLYSALDMLPTQQREAIIMFEILGFSLKEIHDVQGGTLIALKVRLSRGRQALTRLLAEHPTQRRDSIAAPKNSTPAITRRDNDTEHHHRLSAIFS